MALAPFDLFIAVKPHRCALGGGLDTLAIDHACGWLGEPPLTPALDLAQLCHHSLPHGGPTPAPEVPIHRLPMPEGFGQHTPLTPGLIDVYNAIDHAPPV